MKKKILFGKNNILALETRKGRQLLFQRIQKKIKQVEEDGNEIDKIAIKTGNDIYDVTDCHMMGFEITHIRMAQDARIVTRYRADGSIENITRIPSKRHPVIKRFPKHTEWFEAERFSISQEIESLLKTFN